MHIDRLKDKNDKELLKRVKQELYMITGTVHTDINYLYYLLVKDGTIFKQKPEVHQEVDNRTLEEITSDWFNLL